MKSSNLPEFHQLPWHENMAVLLNSYDFFLWLSEDSRLDSSPKGSLLSHARIKPRDLLAECLCALDANLVVRFLNVWKKCNDMENSAKL